MPVLSRRIGGTRTRNARIGSVRTGGSRSGEPASSPGSWGGVRDSTSMMTMMTPTTSLNLKKIRPALTPSLRRVWRKRWGRWRTSARPGRRRGRPGGRRWRSRGSIWVKDWMKKCTSKRNTSRTSELESGTGARASRMKKLKFQLRRRRWSRSSLRSKSGLWLAPDAVPKGTGRLWISTCKCQYVN